MANTAPSHATKHTIKMHDRYNCRLVTYTLGATLQCALSPVTRLCSAGAERQSQRDNTVKRATAASHAVSGDTADCLQLTASMYMQLPSNVAAAALPRL